MPDLTVNLLSDNVLLSGGAKGADAAWGEAAAAAGHQVIHWTFAGHKSPCPKETLVELTQGHLDEADTALRRANKALKRRYPGANQFIGNLLKRNFFQIRWTERIYAVASLEDQMVSGGTGWAVQMYQDRFLHDGANMDTCHAYLFDQVTSQWFQWERSWYPCGTPPKPHGVWTGIGSRDLSSSGKLAITTLLTN